jgi:Holliday junction resolvasome RuvABC endonuclease subunit
MRYLHLRAQLQRVRAAYPDLAAVFYEQAHHRGGAATEYAVGCVATVQAWCAEHGIEHAAVHSATIKKHATGKGNAPKDAVIAAMRRRGFAPTDDNEADALALLDWAFAQGGAR